MAESFKDSPVAKALVCIAAAALIVTGSYIAWFNWLEPAPEMPETMEDVQTLFASDAYARLSTEQRQPYQERAREIMRETGWQESRALMSSEETHDAMRQMMTDAFEQRRVEMTQRARDYALADASTRERMIQEELARPRGGWGGGGGGGPRGGDRSGGGERTGSGERTGGGERGGWGGGDGQGPSEEQRAAFRAEMEERIEGWVNEGNGQDQALVREFREAVRQRREQQQQQ